MNIFLKELENHVGPKKKLAIMMDGAGWHKSKDLLIPDNIRFIIQPPYSPELNPVERFWKYIKDNTIKNKIYLTLQDLENDVCSFMKLISNKKIKTICNLNYIAL